MALRGTGEETQQITEGTLLDVLNSKSPSDFQHGRWEGNAHVLNALDLPKGADVLADIPAYQSAFNLLLPSPFSQSKHHSVLATHEHVLME